MVLVLPGGAGSYDSTKPYSVIAESTYRINQNNGEGSLLQFELGLDVVVRLKMYFVTNNGSIQTANVIVTESTASLAWIKDRIKISFFTYTSNNIPYVAIRAYVKFTSDWQIWRARQLDCQTGDVGYENWRPWTFYNKYVSDQSNYVGTLASYSFRIPFAYEQVGSPSIPVYIDSEGKVQPCTGIGEEFYIPDVTSVARYFTLGWTTIDTNGGLSRLALEIGPFVPYNTNDASLRNGKIIATLRSFNSSNVASILLINMEGLVPDNIAFYTYVADGKLYLVLRLSAYMSGASAKCISHGRPESPYAVGVLYNSTVAPATLTDSNVTYQSLSVQI